LSSWRRRKSNKFHAGAAAPSRNENSMDAKELAEQLDGSEYPFDPTEEQQRTAKEAGLVIVFGASDDLVELRGAVDDEIGVLGGQVFFVGQPEENRCDDNDCPYFQDALRALNEKTHSVEVIWDRDGYSWQCETEIPHATFDIMEGKDKYCRGIVCALADAAK